MTSFEHLDCSLPGAVFLMRFSKPSDSAHLLSTSFLRELREALAQVEIDNNRDQAARLVLLTGQGRSFSAGADIGEINAFEADDVPAFLRTGQSVLRQIMDLDVITVAAINGLALGGGLELALACDIRWAHVSAVFGFPEAKLGLLPGWGGMSLLSRTAPASLCAEMITGGESIGARRACETGLVSRLFEDRDFETAALAEAQKLAGRPASTLAEIKAVLRRLKGNVDLAAGNHEFVRLWNDRATLRGDIAMVEGGRK